MRCAQGVKAGGSSNASTVLESGLQYCRKRCGGGYEWEDTAYGASLVKSTNDGIIWKMHKRLDWRSIVLQESFQLLCMVWRSCHPAENDDRFLG